MYSVTRKMLALPSNRPRSQGKQTDADAGHEVALRATQSGQIPAGDVRLTANLRADLHLKLKIRAAQERTTMGELIEAWIASW